MRLLVAGLTGQLGTALTSVATQAGVDLIPLVRSHRPGRLPLSRALPYHVGHVVEGDVVEPLWGLDDRELSSIAADVDAVVNLAGATNWAGSGRDLFDANVLGAVHGLDVASHIQALSKRRVPYVVTSSIYVAGGALGTVAEAQLPHDGQRTMYEESKWQAERELDTRWRPGEPPVVVARIAALLGDSQTGATLRRNSLYLLAERWHELPGRAIFAMPHARVDALPRDVAARTLLSLVQAVVSDTEGPDMRPQIVHVAAGETAPTLRSLLETARSIDPMHFGDWVRLMPLDAERLLWVTGNAHRFAALSQAWRNSIIGLRYVGLDRQFERSRLHAFVPDLPHIDVARLATLLFDLQPHQLPALVGDAGLARFRP